MDSVSWPVAVDRICDAMAFLLPVIFMRRLDRHEVLFGTVAMGFFLSVPQVVTVGLDPAYEKGGAHIHCHGGLGSWIAMGLINGLLYSLLLYGLRGAFRLGRSFIKRQLARRERSAEPAGSLPVARDVTGSSTSRPAPPPERRAGSRSVPE